MDDIYCTSQELQICTIGFGWTNSELIRYLEYWTSNNYDILYKIKEHFKYEKHSIKTNTELSDAKYIEVDLKR